MDTLGDGFDQPKSGISNIDLAFPARGADPDFIPPLESIPIEFRGGPGPDRERARHWLGLQSIWLGQGLPSTTQFARVEGVDADDAFKHLSVIQGSFAPKHEHKVAAVAWLASRWFEDYSLTGFELIADG